MMDAYSDNDLRELCLWLGLEYDDLTGANRSQRIANLVRRFSRQNNMDGLLAHLKKTRPHIEWPEL